MTTTKHRCAFCGVSEDACDVMFVDSTTRKAPTICGDCVRLLAAKLTRVTAEKQAANLLGPIHRKDHPSWVEEAP